MFHHDGVIYADKVMYFKSGLSREKIGKHSEVSRPWNSTY